MLQIYISYLFFLTFYHQRILKKKIHKNRKRHNNAGSLSQRWTNSAFRVFSTLIVIKKNDS